MPISCCSYARFVVEDRFSAIRWAIATAQLGDVVVVSGKGNDDWTEVADGWGGYMRASLLLPASTVHLACLLWPGQHACANCQSSVICMMLLSMHAYLIGMKHRCT